MFHVQHLHKYRAKYSKLPETLLKPESSPPICDYENSAWRTAFWPGREYEDRAERIALAHMLPPSGDRLCEIGAGFGRLADFYRGYARVILLDYSFSMLRDARIRLQNNPRILFVAADLYNLPLADSTLDTAVTVRVLHHVTDIPRAFTEIARVVRPEGVYLTEFANKRHIKAVLRYVFARSEPNPFTLEPYEFVKLNSDFHPRYVQAELAKSGFAIDDRRAVSTFRLAILKRIVPASLLASLDGAIQHPSSRLQLSPSIFLRAHSKKAGAPALNLALWRCPACKSTDLVESSGELACRVCGRVYPITDGIIDFKSHM
jgi:SAM-dependent methyltransferase